MRMLSHCLLQSLAHILEIGKTKPQGYLPPLHSAPFFRLHCLSGTGRHSIEGHKEMFQALLAQWSLLQLLKSLLRGKSCSGNPWRNRCDCVPVTLDLQGWVAGWVWPADHSFCPLWSTCRILRAASVFPDHSCLNVWTFSFSSSIDRKDMLIGKT